MIVIEVLYIGFNQLIGKHKKISYNLVRIHIRDNILILDMDNNTLVLYHKLPTSYYL